MKFTVTGYKLIVALLPVSGFFLLANIVSAQQYTRTIDRTYEVVDDYVQVTEKRTINIDQSDIYIAAGNEDLTTLFADIRPDEELISNVPDTLNSLSITRANGSAYTNYRIEETGTNPNLRVTFDRNIEAGTPFTVYVGYRSKGIIYKSGKVRDVFIPGLSTDFVFNDGNRREVINTLVKIPKTLGSLSFAIPNGEVTQDATYYYVRFKQEDLLGRSGWIEIGTDQTYEFEIIQKYQKSSDFIFGANTFKLIIPRNIKSGNIEQSVFFESFSPAPTSIRKDENGNLIAEFSISAATEGEISIKGFAKLKKTSIDYSRYTGLLSAIPAEVIQENTQSANFWEANEPDVKAAAISALGNLTTDKSPVYEIAERLYEYVIDKIDYSNVKRFGINERQGALTTLRGGAAVCMEYSDLYIALLRSVGIPARAVFGYGYTGIDSSDSSEHQWVEVYIPELGWVSVDTTWGESAPELIGGDLNHFYIHIASDNPNTPAPVEVAYVGDLGTLEDRQLRVVPSETELTGMSQEEVLNNYPESNGAARSREMAIQFGLNGIKNFYERNKDLMNPLIVLIAFLLIVPVAYKLVKFVLNKLMRKPKKVISIPASNLNKVEEKPTANPVPQEQ